MEWKMTNEMSYKEVKERERTPVLVTRLIEDFPKMYEAERRKALEVIRESSELDRRIIKDMERLLKMPKEEADAELKKYKEEQRLLKVIFEEDEETEEENEEEGGKAEVKACIRKDVWEGLKAVAKEEGKNCYELLNYALELFVAMEEDRGCDNCTWGALRDGQLICENSESKAFGENVTEQMKCTEWEAEE